MVRGPEPVTLAAAQSLSKLRDRPALRWVVAHPDALYHRTPRSRAAVLRGFGRAGLPIIAERLEKGVADPRMERAMIETLGHGGFDAARGAIERRLSSTDVDVRVAAVRALGRVGGGASAALLIARLTDPEWPVRAQAARALGPAGAEEAVAPLRACLTDRAWWVRRHAAYALLELGEAGTQALRDAAQNASDPYARDMANEVLGGGFPTAA
jgi:HEAT repeat protein